MPTSPKKKPSKPADRRSEALSRDMIVQAAIGLLDAEGEAGLTFRALTTRLATGVGAIYWHVDNKDELLQAAADHVVVAAVDATTVDAAAVDVVRALALGLFDAIDAHPWVGAQLAKPPWSPSMLLVVERLGAQVVRLGVPRDKQFAAVCTLVSGIVGVATQNAANSSAAGSGDRDAFLADTATLWAGLDPVRHPFLRAMATSLAAHDDRDDFLVGVDLLLAGLVASATGRAADGCP